MIQKTKLAVAITTALTLTGVLVAPQAEAHKSSKKHYHDTHYYGSKHKHKKVKKAHTAESASTYVAPTSAAYDDSELKRRIAELEARKMPEAAPVKESKDNMVFFRGGYARSNRHRPGVSIMSQVVPVVAQDTADKDAWYFGAGLDFSVDDNLFGLMDNTEVLGEVMFEYKEFNDTVQGNALATNPTPLVVAGGSPRNVTVNQFTLAASPKIKFLKGSDFRPWIIPVGFKMDVVSPPTESITVLNPGMMFGLGADYRVWKNIYVGADARWHQSLGRIDGVDTNGLTAGGYIGLGF
jgi:opacity protein-like surface antigen